MSMNIDNIHIMTFKTKILSSCFCLHLFACFCMAKFLQVSNSCRIHAAVAKVTAVIQTGLVKYSHVKPQLSYFID